MTKHTIQVSGNKAPNNQHGFTPTKWYMDVRWWVYYTRNCFPFLPYLVLTIS